MTQRRQTGNAGEDRAATFLERRGFVIVARNWSCRYGELDLVAREAATVVFVEVRVRKSTGVDWHAQNRPLDRQCVLLFAGARPRAV